MKNIYFYYLSFSALLIFSLHTSQMVPEVEFLKAIVNSENASTVSHTNEEGDMASTDSSNDDDTTETEDEIYTDSEGYTDTDDENADRTLYENLEALIKDHIKNYKLLSYVHTQQESIVKKFAAKMLYDFFIKYFANVLDTFSPAAEPTYEDLQRAFVNTDILFENTLLSQANKCHFINLFNNYTRQNFNQNRKSPISQVARKKRKKKPQLLPGLLKKQTLQSSFEEWEDSIQKEIQQLRHGLSIANTREQLALLYEQLKTFNQRAREKINTILNHPKRSIAKLLYRKYSQFYNDYIQKNIKEILTEINSKLPQQTASNSSDPSSKKIRLEDQ